MESISVAQFGRAAVLAYLLTRRSRALRRALQEKETALLHAHFGVEGVYAVPTAKALGVPLVTTLHGFDVTVGKAKLLAAGKVSWLTYVARRESLFAEGAIFICVSEHIRRCALEWGYPSERLVVLPIGVDVEEIVPVAPSEKPRILHVARLVEKKGTADLLKAFALVVKAVADAQLVIVGEGPEREPLAALANQLGIATAVRFLGAASHRAVLAQMAEARLLCLPSVTAANGDQEGLGMVLLEAAAMGRPVVGTRHGGIPEAVMEGGNGFLVPEKKPAELAERLVTLLREPALCEEFGKAGREMVVERFNLERQTGKLESLYRSLK